MHLHPIATTRPSGADDLDDNEAELVARPCACLNRSQLAAWRGCSCRWPLVREITRRGVLVRRATRAELRAAARWAR